MARKQSPRRRALSRRVGPIENHEAIRAGIHTYYDCVVTRMNSIADSYQALTILPCPERAKLSTSLGFYVFLV